MANLSKLPEDIIENMKLALKGAKVFSKYRLNKYCNLENDDLPLHSFRTLFKCMGEVQLNHK